MFACAIALSSIAGFYSIFGLIAIFAAMPAPIAVMGTTLEVSKLVVASWLYRNWNDIPRLIKGYLTLALASLMFLTSMGIFGFLSKAHIEQSLPVGNIIDQVKLIDERIQVQRDNISGFRKTLTQLDQQIDKYTELGAVTKGVEYRRQQAKEREDILDSVGEAQKRISELNEEKAVASAAIRETEVEVGPIKYIAALMYGDQLDQTLMEKAVRAVILLIVFVFDPLAVAMLIAANWSLLNVPKTESLCTTSADCVPIDYFETVKDNIYVDDEHSGSSQMKQEVADLVAIDDQSSATTSADLEPVAPPRTRVTAPKNRRSIINWKPATKA